jgi:2-dehydro-3-deoxyphosphogalactonate aldolase
VAILRGLEPERAADVASTLFDAGGRLMVSPNFEVAVIARARELGLFVTLGVATPAEAFAALAADANVLKLFPAEVVGTAGLKAMASVLPAGTGLWPVGGVTPVSLAGGVKAGASGFGIGSQIFRPGMAIAEIAAVAREFGAAWQATR